MNLLLICTLGFTIIVNSLKSLGEKITNEKMVKKILRSLTKDWKTKTTAIEEAKDLSTLTIDDLIGSLLAYEVQVKEDEEEEEKPKRKQIALKAEKMVDDEDDDDIALLTRRFNRFLKKKKNFGKFKKNH